jgi:hypothetical protein
VREIKERKVEERKVEERKVEERKVEERKVEERKVEEKMKTFHLVEESRIFFFQGPRQPINHIFVTHNL